MSVDLNRAGSSYGWNSGFGSTGLFRLILFATLIVSVANGLRGRWTTLKETIGTMKSHQFNRVSFGMSTYLCSELSLIAQATTDTAGGIDNCRQLITWDNRRHKQEKG
jgi:hypothetical protein